MKKISIYTLMLAIALISLQACGPTEKERKAKEEARLDSLRQVEQQRIDSLMAAREDSIAQSKQTDLDTETETEKSGDVNFAENGQYAVQVGAWRSEKKATSYVNKWSDRGYPSNYVVKTGDEETGDIWFRVRIGFFSSKEEAEKLGTELAAEINTGYWVTQVR